MRRTRDNTDDSDADEVNPPIPKRLRSHARATGIGPRTHGVETSRRRRTGTRIVPALPAIDLPGSLRSAPVATWAPTRHALTRLAATRYAPTSLSPYATRSRARPTATVTSSGAIASSSEASSSATSLLQPTGSLLSMASIPSSAASSTVVSYYPPLPSTSASLSLPTTSLTRPKCPLCSKEIDIKDLNYAENCDLHGQHPFHRNCLRGYRLSNQDHPLSNYLCPSCRVESHTAYIDACKPAGIHTKFYMREEPGTRKSFLSSYAVTMASLDPEHKQCSVCWDDLEDENHELVIPQCGHLSHGDCLRKDHTFRNRSKCPTCREEITVLAYNIEDQNNFDVVLYKDWIR